MKLAIVLLTVLGVLAAGSAALVVSGLNSRPEGATAQVLVVQSDLPAATCLTAEHVKREPILMSALPRGSLIDPTQAIGRYLLAPIMKGQVVTEASLAVRGSLTEKMLMLPPGMTVATVTVPSRSVSGGLLQRGCYVQVFATLRDSGTSEIKSVSGTLFTAMQVWSLGDESEETAADAQGWMKGQAPPSGSGTTGMVKVNLLATYEQAGILQMVIDRGTITLTIRSPREEREQSAPQRLLVVDERLRRALGLMPDAPAPSGPVETVYAYAEPNDVNTVVPTPPRPPWIVKVIRGAQVGVEEFPPLDGEIGRNQ